MKLKHLLYIIAFTPSVTFAQGNLHTIGGTSTAGYTGDGSQGTAAQLDSPSRTRVDNEGNVYFIQSSHHVVRKISANGIITTVAGTGTAGYNGDNIMADTAKLNNPSDIALDDVGNLYIADKGNNRIRRVDKFTGLIETVAGDGQNMNAGDGGPAISASLESPHSLAIDKYDTLYVGAGLQLRKFYIGGDIFLDYWTSHTPQTICFDSVGNMYYVLNNQIWREGVNNSLLGIAGTSVIGNPINEGMMANVADIEMTDLIVTPDSSIYVASKANNRIYRISSDLKVYTVAGGGNSTAENVSPTNAAIVAPMGVGLDTCGNIYFADAGSNRERAVTYTPCSPLAINNIASLPYALYPNPATTSFVIEAATELKNITVINSLGQTVASITVNNKRTLVNTADLSKGLYFVKVVDNNGAQRTEKLTIQ